MLRFVPGRLCLSCHPRGGLFKGLLLEGPRRITKIFHFISSSAAFAEGGFIVWGFIVWMNPGEVTEVPLFQLLLFYLPSTNIYNLRIRTIQSTPLSIWYYSNSSRTGTRRLGQNKKDSVPSSSIITNGPDKISSFSSAHYCTRRWEFDFIIWKIKGDPFWHLSDDGIILAALFAGSYTSNLQVQVWTHESYQVQ